MTFHRALTKYNIGSFGRKKKKKRVWTLVHIKKITVMTEVIVGKKTKKQNFFFLGIFFLGG